MNRLRTALELCAFAALCSGSLLHARAQVEPDGPAAGPAAVPVQEVQSSSSSSTDDPGDAPNPGAGSVQASLEAGYAAKERGDLAAAELHFRDALAGAESGSDTYMTALEELTFRLPVNRAEGLIASDEWEEAIGLLERLLEKHDADLEKSRYLLQVIAALQQQAPDAAAGGSQDFRGMISEVERILEDFRRENGRYPSDYRELNEILPADQAPLTRFDIVDYVGEAAAYGLTIRSKTEPGNEVKLQKTGLVQ